MGKLFIKILSVVLLTSWLYIPQIGHANKVAAITVNELTQMAQIIAVVEILKTEVTNKPHRKIYTTTESRLVKHEAKIATVIKGQIRNERIRFFHVQGLSAGQQYVIFLNTADDGSLMSAYGQFSALALSVVSMKTGVVSAVRIPTAFISLPATLNVEPGVIAKYEQSAYVWATEEDFVELLKNNK